MALGLLLLSSAAPEPVSGPVTESAPPALTPAELRARVGCEMRQLNPRLNGSVVERIGRGIERCIRDQSLPADLVIAVLGVESSGRPHAHSPMGALGLMQVMPHMYEQLELPGHPALIETNLEAGCILLADNIARWGEDDGISAYFWGSKIRDERYLNKVRAMRGEIEPRFDPGAETCG